MAQNNAATDARTDNQKIQMAETFKEYEAEYRDEPKHREIVYEDDDCVIIADHTGNEINEWANMFDTDREYLRSTFRTLAEQKVGEKDAHETFSYSDPVVFDKFEN